MRRRARRLFIPPNKSSYENRNQERSFHVKTLSLPVRFPARPALALLLAVTAASFAGCGKEKDEARSEAASARKVSVSAARPEKAKQDKAKPIWDDDIPDRDAAETAAPSAKGSSAKEKEEDAAPAGKASADRGAKALQEGLAAYKRRKYADAVKSFREAADAGSDEAMFKLAVCYLDGKGVRVNEGRGLDYLEMAADAGNAKASFLLLMHGMDESYMDDRTIEKKIRKVAPDLLKAAESGDPEAQALAALMCMTIGDIAGAQKWTIEAEENGFDGDF